MSNNTYTIVPFADVTQDIVDTCLETSIETLRHTTEGDDLVILKWEGSTPSLLLGYNIYTYSEILTEIAQPEWNEVESSSLGE